MLEGCEVFTALIQQMRSSRKLFKKCAEKVGSSDASSYALKDHGKRVQGDLSHCWYSQDKICMHRWSRRIYGKAFRRNSTQRSWRPPPRKRNHFVEPLQSCAQSYSYASKQWKYLRQKQQWTKNGEKLEKILAWQLKKVRNKKKQRSMKQGKKAKTVHCFINGSLSSQVFGGEPKTSKIQRSSHASRRRCERWSRLFLRIYEGKFNCVKDDSWNSNGCHSKATRMRRTSSRRNISLHPGQNGRCSIDWNVQSQNVQIFGFVYQNTNGRNHGPVWKIQSFLWNEICTVTHLLASCGKDNSRKSYWNTVGKKCQTGECFL